MGIWSAADGFSLLSTDLTVPTFVDDYATIGSGGTLVEYIVDTTRGYINTVLDAGGTGRDFILKISRGVGRRLFLLQLLPFEDPKSFGVWVMREGRNLGE